MEQCSERRSPPRPWPRPGSAPRSAAAETVAMIGTGNVGAALGRRFAENGHKIVYGSRDPSAADVRELVAATGHGAVAVTQAEAAAQADIVVLAVPWSAAEDVVRALPRPARQDRRRPDEPARHGERRLRRLSDRGLERRAHRAPRARRARRQSVQHARRRDDARPQARRTAPSRCRSSATTARRRSASRRWLARSGSRPSTSARCATRASSRACITCGPMPTAGASTYHLPRDHARD